MRDIFWQNIDVGLGRNSKMKEGEGETTRDKKEGQRRRD
jgi:hypothetical protein